MFNLTNTAKIVVPALALLATAVSFSSHASVTPDRTRLVFNESDKSISVTLRNNDPTLPYLAQSWIEDAKGNKISSPLAVLPPVQRIDAMMNGQVKVQGLPDINKLPADRESVFYFNVREIPPKSNKPNTLQIALQTRIKLFWRPANIRLIPEDAAPKVKWRREGRNLIAENPNPIHISVMDVIVDGHDVPLNMIRPFETLTLPLPANSAGGQMTWRFINDYGAVSDPIKMTL